MNGLLIVASLLFATSSASAKCVSKKNAVAVIQDLTLTITQGDGSKQKIVATKAILTPRKTKYYDSPTLDNLLFSENRKVKFERGRFISDPNSKYIESEGIKYYCKQSQRE